MNDIVQAMLVDVPVGASPAGGACSVATVVMLDNGKGDRPAESSGVEVSVGWGKAQSDPVVRQNDIAGERLKNQRHPDRRHAVNNLRGQGMEHCYMAFGASREPGRNFR